MNDQLLITFKMSMNLIKSYKFENLTSELGRDGTGRNMKIGVQDYSSRRLTFTRCLKTTNNVIQTSGVLL